MAAGMLMPGLVLLSVLYCGFTRTFYDGLPMEFRTASFVILCTILLSACNREPGDAYRLDLEPLTTIDPARITWRQTNVVKSPVPHPTAIAGDAVNGRLFIAGGKEVVRLDASWKETDRVSLSLPAVALAADVDSSLLIATDTSVLRWPGAGGNPPEVVWELSDGISPCAMAQVGGKLFLADSDAGYIRAFDATGRPLPAIGAEKVAGGAPHFILPSRVFDLASDPGGTLWAVNPGRHKLENYRADGSYIGSWGQSGAALEGFAGCCNPSHITILPNGRFITAEKGLTRIKEYDQQGTFQGVVCTSDRVVDSGAGLDLAALGNGRVAVLDPPAAVVRIFERKPSAEPNDG